MSRLPINEILSRAARDPTPCPGSRASSCGLVLRGEGRPAAAALWTAIGVVALAGALGGIAWGLAMVADGGPLG